MSPIVEIGHEIRRGAVTADGRGEVVLGLGFMLMGENSHEVTCALKNKLEEIKTTLPPGSVKSRPVYDRTELVDHVIDTVQKNLFEGGLLVVAVLFAVPRQPAGGLIVALAIPLSMLFAFSGMLQFGIAASLLSLGAIDFGMVVDSSVVMVENCVRRIWPTECQTRQDATGRHPRRGGRSPQADDVRRTHHHDRLPADPDAGGDRGEAVPADGADGDLCPGRFDGAVYDSHAGSGQLFFARQDGRTRTAADSCCQTGLRTDSAFHHAPKGCGDWVCRWCARVCVWHDRSQLGLGVCPASCPRVHWPSTSSGWLEPTWTSRSASTPRWNGQCWNSFPDEVEHVWSRIGSAEVATDPMGVELTDMFITLQPREQWTKATSQAELTELGSEVVAGNARPADRDDPADRNAIERDD